jgi:hypothetical protein
MRLIILVIAIIMVVGLGVSGCGVGLYEYTEVGGIDHINNARVVEVWHTDNFTEVERGSLGEAIGEWNYVLNGQMEIGVVGDFDSEDMGEWLKRMKESNKTGDSWLIFKIDSGNEILGEVREGVLAFVPELGSRFMVILGDRIGTKDLKTIMMHEIGHMLGAMHVNIDYTLMVSGYGYKQADCIDLLTVRQVAKYNDMDISGMNYCEVPE